MQRLCHRQQVIIAEAGARAYYRAFDESDAIARIHMRHGTYRFIVISSILSSFLVGLHVPALHEIIEHGTTPRWDVLMATIVLTVAAAAGTWMLLRAPGRLT